MAEIQNTDEQIGAEIRGKILAPSEYGGRNYGAFEYGAGADVQGIYRVRTVGGRRIQEKMPLYWPTNPQTEAQQANRAKMTAGVLAWQALSEAAKNTYRDRAKYRPLTGFNLFLREYLLTH